MITRRFLSLLAVILLGLIACNKAKREPDNPKLAKIAILSSGQILLNGRPASLEQVTEALKTAKVQNGQVWYYRENPTSEPPAQAIQIMQVIEQNRLPVSFSTKPDYSDVVDDQGQSHPRPQK